MHTTFLSFVWYYKDFFLAPLYFFSLLGDNIKAQRGRKILPGQTVGCLLMHNQFPVFFFNPLKNALLTPICHLQITMKKVW